MKRLMILIGSLAVLNAVPFPTFGEEGKIGQKLFEDRCAACHGLDARGSLKMAESLKIEPLRLDLTRDEIIRRSPEDLRKLIAVGHGKMPKHQEMLNAEQIQSLIIYLLSLQKSYVLDKIAPK